MKLDQFTFKKSLLPDVNEEAEVVNGENRVVIHKEKSGFIRLLKFRGREVLYNVAFREGNMEQFTKRLKNISKIGKK